MARLFEYQSKEILKREGIKIPNGFVISDIDEFKSNLNRVKFPIVIKGQIYIKGRAAKGLIKFASNIDEAESILPQMLNKNVDGFTIKYILIEEKLSLQREMFCASVIDDGKRCQVILFSSIGGSGIEEIAKENPDKFIKYPVSQGEELYPFQIRNALNSINITGSEGVLISEFLVRLCKIQKKYEARSLEINPLILTQNGELIALDCHMVIDDYAVFRHPELPIEIAREFDRPPTELERIAYNVEKGDFRGTFYFIQMSSGFSKDDNYVGFHGAGGGGSMMSMDALLAEGFKVANFCDTSGNPPAGKVYRAAKIILSQKNLTGYFGSGSGVASQEQYHSARGLTKAFLENDLEIPAVLRLGGNKEDEAIGILTNYTKSLSSTVECYGKNSSASFCAERLKNLVSEKAKLENKNEFKNRNFEGPESYNFKTVTDGRISFYYEMCKICKNKICIDSCEKKILHLENGFPRLSISEDDARRGKCTECLACELECFFKGGKGLKISLPIKGLDEIL